MAQFFKKQSTRSILSSTFAKIPNLLKIIFCFSLHYLPSLIHPNLQYLTRLFYLLTLNSLQLNQDYITFLNKHLIAESRLHYLLK